MAKSADPGHQPLDAFEAYRGCVWWMLHQWYRWRHWPTPSSVCARGRLSCRNSCKSISARWKKLSAGIPEGQRDIQRMISIKWSLSCSSSNEILYLCFRLLRLLDVTLKSCVILYLLLTGDTAAGWPPRHRRRVSQYVRCACVSVVRVWMDLETRGDIRLTTRPPDRSRTVIAVLQPRWSHWRRANSAKNVITLLCYFNRPALTVH